ncbi:MAG: hypothetical protein ACE37F_10325 [Nannocystaceae bacterium]|nr:hypothetical protein [bacterium]
MTSPRPHQPPLWRTLALGAGAAAAVGLILVWLLHEAPDAQPAPEGMVLDEDGELVDARVRFEADLDARRRAAIPRTSASQILGMLEGPGPGAAPVSDIQAARDGFSAIVAEIEVAAERPRALKQREWRAYYRAANDAFSALSSQLDGKDPKQAKELEEAHKELVNALAIVRVRGGKFKIR